MVQRSPRRRLSVDERRAEILASAVEAAREVGLVGLTLLEVRERAGVSAGLINHYFASLDGIRVAVFRELFGTVVSDGDASPSSQLAALIGASVSADSFAEARAWVDAMQLGRSNGEMRREVVVRMALDRTEMAAVIRRGCATEAFRSEDPERSATRILVAVDGYLMQFLLEEGVVRAELRSVVWDIAESELGLAPGVLRLEAASGDTA